MGSASTRPTDELQLTPGEARHLRRLVRKQVVTWSGLAGGLGALAAWLAIGSPARIEVAEVPHPADDRLGAATLTAETRGPAPADLEAELSAVRMRLGALEQAAAADPESRSDPSGAVDRLAARVKQLERRPPSTAAAQSGGVTGERLFNIEQRLDAKHAAVGALEKRLLARAENLEVRRNTLEEKNAAAQRAFLERLDNLEGRLYDVERRQGGGPPEPSPAPGSAN